MLKKIASLYFILALISPLAMATKIQQQGIVTTTDCSNRGAANSVCLPLTSQIYDTQNSQTLATSIANGQLGGAGGSSGIELLTNPNFENGAITNGWSTSGGTAALVASGSTGFLFGNYSASWTASASSQTFKSTAVALNGLAGGNCSASLYYTYGGTSGDYLFEAIDGSSNVLASLSLPAQSSAAQKTITWACNSSTSATVQWVLKSNVASPSIIYFDNAHLGSNTNIGTVQQAQFIGDVIITGCASNWSTAATSISDYGTQTGCTYTTTGSLGAPSTNLPGFSLSGGAGTYVVVYGGEAGNNSSTGGNVFFQLYDGTNSSLETLVNAVGTGVSGAFVGNLTFHITESAPFSSKQFRVRGYVASTESNAIWGTTATPGVFHVYYYPTSAQSVFAANGAAANWSGGSSKMGTTTATAPSDPSSVSGSVTTLNSQNISCTDIGGEIGINCTVPSAGVYNVCFTGVASNNTANGVSYFLLTDGSNNLFTGISYNQEYTGGGSGSSFTLCGNEPVSSTSLMAKLRVYTVSGQTATYNLQSINVVSLNTSVAAPIVQGSISTNASGAWRVESAAVSSVCSSSPCTITTQSGSWVSSITRTSAGVYVVNFQTGAFSSSPVCNVFSNAVPFMNTIPNTSGFTLNTYSTSFSASDTTFDIICMGPH